MNSPNRFWDTLLQVTVKQSTTGAVQFDGTTGKGLFKVYMARRIIGVLVKSSVKCKIEIFICLPDPNDETQLTEYPWDDRCGSFSLLNNDHWSLPRNSEVKIRTTDGADVEAQLIFGLLEGY